MYNNYASEHAFWADTTNMDNLRGADMTHTATPGAMEVSSTPETVTGFGNTVHTYSGDETHVHKCSVTVGTVSSTGGGWYRTGDCYGDDAVWILISNDGAVGRRTYISGEWTWADGGYTKAGQITASANCNVFNFKNKGDSVLNEDGTMVYDPDGKTITFYGSDGKSSMAGPFTSSEIGCD